jgi:MORN repeat
VYKDGSVYVGQVRDGKRHGRGVLSVRTNGDVYAGNWRNDERHGWGVLTNADGTVESGIWTGTTVKSGALYIVWGMLSESLLSPPFVVTMSLLVLVWVLPTVLVILLLLQIPVPMLSSLLSLQMVV